MKTAVPASTLSAALLALQLCRSHGFVVAGNARVTARSTSSSLASRDLSLVRRPATSCATCRMAADGGDEEQPKTAQGFGQPQAASGTHKGRRGAAKSSKKSKGMTKAGEAVEGVAKETTGTSSQRNMLLQFQCSKCDTISQYMIGKVAYEDGIVICTCKGCQARHLIADNLKKMDFPEFGDNIEDYMKAKGMSDEVTRAKAPNFSPEVLEKYDLSVGEDGTVNLSPKVDQSS